LEFVDFEDKAELMIVDNNTIDPEADNFFEIMSKQSIIKKFNDRVPNELYRAMNYAIKYCMKHKIPIINFIQDDYQYLYRIEGLISQVLKCFKNYKKVGQIHTNLVWKRKKVGKYKIRNFEGINYAFLTEKRLVDSGFTRVRLYKKVGLYPTNMISYDQNSSKTLGFGKKRYSKKRPNGEIWFGKKCRDLGYVRAMSFKPNLGMMFDCAYVRKWQMFGNYFPPPNKYYLKPFDTQKIKAVKRNHAKKKFCFIEKLIEPDGWKPTTFDKHNRQNIIKEIICYG